MLANVIKLIGKDKAIQKINEGQIKFVKQSPKITIENSALEVNADIYDLTRLHNLDFDQIDVLLNKIKMKIREESVDYF